MSTAKTPGKVYKATDCFVANVAGRQVAVTKGETVREGHPLLKGRAGLFELVDHATSFEA